MFQDLRYALRLLAKSPGFTAIVILTLALGIGANTAIFNLVNTTFLRALPYAQPDRLVQVNERNPEGNTFSVSYPNFVDWQKQQDMFSGLAAFHGAEAKLKTDHGTEIVAVQHVSAQFFDVLGVMPAQGRPMEPADDVDGAERAGWLTHDAWQRLFGGEDAVVGRSFLFDGRNLTIVGILPAEFRFYRGADVFTALAPFVRENLLDMRESRSNMAAIARLAPGMTLAEAQTRMDAIAARLAADHPDANKSIGVKLELLRERLAGGARTQLMLLLGAVGLVLLIACVNVANMLLARSFAREREMAIRTSLGASRWHLLRQLLIESAALATAGGAAGALVGVWAFEFIRRLVPGSVQRLVDGETFDARTLLFIAGITLVTGVVFGLAPAWQLSHIRPIDALKQASRDVRTIFGRVRLSDALVVVQVAVALTLLISAGLMIRSLDRLLQVDPGYDPARVLTVEVVAPPVERFQREPSAFTRHFERALEPVQHLPEVESAAMVSCLPFSSNNNSIMFYRGDQPPPAPGQYPSASVHSITPDYFRTMGIPLLRGSVFDGTEPAPVLPEGVEITPQNLAVVFKGVTFSGIISQKMANDFWPGEDPIGKRFRLGLPNMGLPWVEVVGVVGSTVQFGLDRGETSEFYLPLRQWPLPMNMHLVARTRLDPTAATNTIRSAIMSAGLDEPVRDIRVLSERIERSTAGRRFNRNLFAGFAVTALVLAVIGLYGVLAFNVGRRTREVGIRMALGANRRDVIRSVVLRGLALVAPGLLVGASLAWLVGRVLQSQLFEISPSDPITYLAGALLLLATATAAAIVPARRAARVDPLQALRTE